MSDNLTMPMASISPIIGRVLQGHERILAAAQLGYRFVRIGSKLSTFPLVELPVAPRGSIAVLYSGSRVQQV